MSRADNGVDDLDDEFTQQAKDAANAAAAREEVAQEDGDTPTTGTSDQPVDPVPGKAKAPAGGKSGSSGKKSDKAARDDDPATARGTGKAAAKKSDTAEASTKRTRREKKPPKVASGLNPDWWAPVMVGLMVLGLVWLVVYYLSGSKYPIPNVGLWNLGIGFILLMAGFAMTTRWK